ncbi:hypothetical protein Tco_0680426 [Tanacetum coccineum]|uniref:Transposase (Putative), gypsy type n=1 Tax=Tanacetum coccineum TaxID=301880 RepID=A0ABQ4XM31_9ASTR
MRDLPHCEKLNENHTLIRKYPEVFLSIIGLSRTFVDTDVCLTLLIRDKNYRCWLQYSLLLQTILLVNYTIVDELKETCGKKKRKVSFTAGLPPVKKSRSGGIIISEPSSTTAGKTAAAMKKLITHSGQRDDESGSVQDKNVRTRPAPDHFVVLTSGSETLDTDVQTEADTVSPKVTSPIPYVQTEAKAVVAGFVNEIGTSSIPENETGASSSSLGDGSPIDDFYESQTIDSATAHDIYAYLGNQIDAEFLDCLNVNSAQHRDVKVATLKSKLKRLEGEAAYVFVLRRRVSELETEAVGRSKELAGLNAQNAKLLGKVSELESTHDELKGQVSKLKADYVSLCDEIACVSKMRAEFMSIQVAKAQRFTERPAELDARIAELNYDMDTKLYPYIMTAVAGRRWMIVHGLIPIMMKCSQSTEYHAALESPSLWLLIKKCKRVCKLGLSMLEKVSFSLLDQLEALKDSPLELLMSSLTLEGNHGPESISHEILLSDAIAASHNHAEKRKANASSSLAMSRPFVVMPFVSTQETSLVVAYYHISSVAIVDDTVPSAKPHDDLFDTTVLDKPVDP